MICRIQSILSKPTLLATSLGPAEITFDQNEKYNSEDGTSEAFGYRV